jgi:protein O-GlcNAc transferase
MERDRALTFIVGTVEANSNERSALSSRVGGRFISRWLLVARQNLEIEKDGADGQTLSMKKGRNRAQKDHSTGYSHRTMMMKVSTVAWAGVFLIVLSLCISPLHAVTLDFETRISTENGLANLQEGRRLLGLQDYDRAAMHFWRAVMLQSASPNDYTVEEAFQSFVQCFAVQGRTADGFVYIAQESFARKQDEMGRTYLAQALAVNPNHEEALLLQEQLQLIEGPSRTIMPSDSLRKKKKDEFEDKTAEELYAVASEFFSSRDYEQCADVFEISCAKSKRRLFPSCVNAIYCRNMIIDWGFNGTQFDQDMARIEQISKLEISQYRTQHDNGTFFWKRSASVHPHMMLGYPVDPKLKRYITESAAAMDEVAARVQTDGSGVRPLPEDLPFDPAVDRARFALDAAEPGFKIRVGFVASGFNSKAVLYLSHDMFRFFDKTKFEVHIFSMGPPDSPLFIQHGMRGVDWRERVKSNVDYFHDVQKLKMDHVNLARFIHSQKVHILIEWDGYARQGERAQGLFALRPAPVQILHQGKEQSVGSILYFHRCQ